MRYWEACEAQVTAAEAIEECRKHGIEAAVRDCDGALIDKDSGDVIGLLDQHLASPSCLHFFEDTSLTAERPECCNCGRASLPRGASGANSPAKDKRPG